MLLKITSMFFVLSTVIFFNACSSDLFNQTPKCSNSNVIETLKSVLDNESRKSTIHTDLIMQRSLDKETGMRTCTAVVDFTDINNGLMGSIKEAVGVDKVSKDNKVIYTLIMNDIGDKYILQQRYF